MNTEIQEAEIISEEITAQTETQLPTELAVIIKDAGLPMESTTRITQRFTPYLARLSDFSKKLQPLLDKMATGVEPDKDDIKLASLIRKSVKSNRVEATHEKKDEKEMVIKKGRFVDSLFKTIESAERII